IRSVYERDAIERDRRIVPIGFSALELHLVVFSREQVKSAIRDQLVRFKTVCAFGVCDFNRTKNRMGHERRKTAVGMLQRHLQNMFVDRARAERVWSYEARSGAFDVGK